MKPCVLMEQVTRWEFDVSVPVSEDAEARTIVLKVEVAGPYPSMYYTGVLDGRTMTTDGERSFAVQQAKDFVRDLIKTRA